MNILMSTNSRIKSFLVAMTRAKRRGAHNDYSQGN